MSDPIKIVVCLKQVLDPEAPISSLKIDAETKKISGAGVPPVINPYDESALELALKLKDSGADVKITAISFGQNLARAVLMKSLAVGADELYLIDDDADADGRITASVLAACIKKTGFDLILCGRQAADTNAGTVGPVLAEMLEIPSVMWAKNISLDENSLVVDRIIPDGYEKLKGPLPALVTVSHEAGELRLPKLMDIRKAKKKPIHELSIQDLETGQIPSCAIACEKLEPPSRKRQCNIMEADTPAEAGKKLASILMDEGILNL